MAFVEPTRGLDCSDGQMDAVGERAQIPYPTLVRLCLVLSSLEVHCSDVKLYMVKLSDGNLEKFVIARMELRVTKSTVKVNSEVANMIGVDCGGKRGTRGTSWSMLSKVTSRW
jgi:hypothetical protein